MVSFPTPEPREQLDNFARNISDGKLKLRESDPDAAAKFAAFIASQQPPPQSRPDIGSFLGSGLLENVARGALGAGRFAGETAGQVGRGALGAGRFIGETAGMATQNPFVQAFRPGSEVSQSLNQSIAEEQEARRANPIVRDLLEFNQRLMESGADVALGSGVVRGGSQLARAIGVSAPATGAGRIPQALGQVPEAATSPAVRRAVDRASPVGTARAFADEAGEQVGRQADDALEAEIAARRTTGEAISPQQLRPVEIETPRTGTLSQADTLEAEVAARRSSINERLTPEQQFERDVMLARAAERGSPEANTELLAISETAQNGPPRVNGAPTGHVPPPQTLSSTEDAVKVLRDGLFEPVQGSQIDAAASRYWAGGSFDELAAAVPPKDITVSPEFIGGDFRNIGTANSRTMTPTILAQTIDNGFFNGPVQKHVLWPARKLLMSSLRFSDDHVVRLDDLKTRFGMTGLRGKKLRETASDVMESMSSEMAGTQSVGELMLEPKIFRHVRNLKPDEQARVVEYATQMRKFFDDMLLRQNQVRTTRGQELIPSRENYVPWVRDTNIFARLGFRGKTLEIDQPAPIPDFIKPSKAFNPRALAREGGLENLARERDVDKLARAYVDTAAKDIFNTEVIRNTRAHTAAMREMGGLDTSARALDDWASEAFAGQLTPFGKGVRSVAGQRATNLVVALRRSLTRAVFPLNFSWNLVVQTSSIVPTVTRYGPVNAFKGLDYIFTSSGRRWARQNTYSTIVKRRSGGRITRQVETAGDISLRQEQNTLNTVENVMNFLTNAIEDNLTGVSARAAYHDGLAKGLKGRALIEWASEGGSKTQSMYNIHDVTGALRSRELQALVPFQTFAFEMMNNMREILGPIARGARAGAFETLAARNATEQGRIINRAKMVLTFAAGMYVYNMFGEKTIDRKPWVVGSFLPFYGLMTSSINAGNPFGQPLPSQYASDWWQAVGDIVRRDNWRRMRRWAIRYHAPAGTQINRMIDGIAAVSRGEVNDVAGRTLYEVDPDEWFTAITQGPGRTRGGREFIESRFKGSEVEQLLGIDIPERKD